MKSMSLQMIVVPGLPLTAEHRRMLEEAVPEAEIVFYEKMPSASELRGADFILGNPPLPLLKGCGSLKVLQLRSAGVHGYLEAIPGGCRLLNATGAYGLAVSEHMLALIFALMKKINLYVRNQEQSAWKDEGQVSSVEGSTVLIVGMGDIGTNLAKKIKALGGKTIGVRRSCPACSDVLDEGCSQAELDQVIPKADIITLSLPETPETHHIINRGRLKLMKKNAILINAGRGSAIDTAALCDALEQGEIAAAGLDVTDPEPLPPDARLWHMPNVVITPHVAGGPHLPATVTRIVEIAAENFRAYLDGRPLKNEIDPVAGY